MTLVEREFAARIQASIRADACRARDIDRIGPFLATFSREDANPFLNYAIPEANAQPSAEDVQGLISAYRTRGRRPRLEYLPELAPAVEAKLLAEGFEIEGRLPLMTTASSDLVPSDVPGIELVSPSSEEDFRAAVSVQSEAYGGDGVPSQRQVDSLRRVKEAGAVVVLARAEETKEPAGAGLCTPPQDGLTELTSIGVRAQFRRRGIAGAMTSWLAARAYAGGATCVFLMAYDAEARIYERAGFRARSEVLHISRD